MTCPTRTQPPRSWTVTPARYDNPDVQQLLWQLHTAQLEMYGYADDPTDTPAEDYTPPQGLFLLAREVTARPAGCGGWRSLDASTAEVKRMYVHPDTRGQSLGRELLLRLETDARLRGYTHMQLETGVANVAALALYRQSGYLPITPYRPGRDPQINRALRKAL
ncbi:MULTISPECIES: GNAT family N-acetyltransferase [Streptomyces]|uniref:GNAT family N-acetyltransferase n=1 Tax=Streptomyces TaxID=1883 RepID=UPI000A361813|nr:MULTISPECIES: GNAT family N-acetyltransferase [Streptomyces]QTI90459.1 GNAT family N-acetyltransferase [Streptomyces sp. AgN23]WTA86600.1 GNAT family N-acetyltransferase [Streptomyces antimycoticus]WTB11055.1 GNAT family N-acetyltransferase [Streptomyces antimycoticus]